MLTCFLWVFSFLCFTSANTLAAAPLMNPDVIVWKSLHFEAVQGMAHLAVDINLSTVSHQRLQAGSAAGEGLPALAFPANQVWQLLAGIRLEHILGNYNTQDHFWFLPANAAVIEREKIRSGGKQYVKRYRYQPNATHRLRIRPDNKKEYKRSATEWSDRKHTVYSYQGKAESCGMVSEPAMLFYVASAHDFSDGQPMRLCVFSDSALFTMIIQPDGFEKIDVDYTLRQKDTSHRVQGSIHALRLRVSAKRLAGFSDDAEFEVLDFKGNQTLFVDPQQRIPLRIYGSVQGMGEGSADIRQLTLR
ncbi:MAG: DUF3108 domain-containing protein [gamma proteobacterium symbiont of Bathyaustriella thionipta]|nr:DUF3108 domain-containing protein [gamma proteobacterium symbiont of Bathyaustriella thionipta]